MRDRRRVPANLSNLHYSSSDAKHTKVLTCSSMPAPSVVNCYIYKWCCSRDQCLCYYCHTHRSYCFSNTNPTNTFYFPVSYYVINTFPGTLVLWLLFTFFIPARPVKVHVLIVESYVYSHLCLHDLPIELWLILLTSLFLEFLRSQLKEVKTQDNSTCFGCALNFLLHSWLGYIIVGTDYMSLLFSLSCIDINCKIYMFILS